jgi:cytochrome P450
MIGAPGPKGYPLVGVMPKLWRDPLGFLSESIKNYGDIVCLRRDRLYLLNHPDYVQQVFRDKRALYSKNREAASSKNRSHGNSNSKSGDGGRPRRLILGTRSVALSEGDDWRRQRSMVQPVFSRAHFADLSLAVASATAAMLERWRSAASASAPLDIEREMHALILQVLVKALFGNSLESDAELATMVRAVADTHEFFDSRVGSLISIPESVPTPANRRFHRAHKTLTDFLDQTIAERRASGRWGTDLLGLVASAKDARSGEGLSRTELQDEMVMLSILGHKTTATALTWAFFLLAASPTVDERLHLETIATLGGRNPALEDLPRLAYIRQVLEESMRLYPPTWIIGRVALENDVVGGYTVPAGATVLLSPYLLHRHRAFWDEPEAFHPERFSLDRAPGGPRPAYLPFGDGDRMCIASHFAMMQMSLVLAQVVANYRLSLAPGPPVQPQPRAVLRPRNGLKMFLHARTETVYANAG